MMAKSSNEVTLIVYDTPSPPKCIKIKKSVIRLFVIIVPLITAVAIAITLYITSNLKRLEQETQRKQPKLINKLKAEIALINKQLDQTNTLNQELSFKVSQGSPTIGAGVSLFKIPLGFTDKTEQMLAKTSNTNFEVTNKMAQITFDLTNNGVPGTKLSGYIFVIQLNGSGVKFYPDNTVSTKDYLLKYNSGEAFTASRFRPVVAKFKVQDIDEDLYYKAFIFSRTGDLILQKVFGPFTAEE
jgi:hypothetical protein